MTVTTSRNVGSIAHDISRPKERTAYEVLQRGGVGAVLHRATRRVLRPVCRWVTYWFYERDLTRPVAQAFAAKVPVEARMATCEDFERFRDVFHGAGVSLRKIEERRRRGDVCFLGVVDGRLLHFSWIAVRSATIAALDLTVRLQPGEVYAYNGYTVPEARGLGIQLAVVDVMFAWERQQRVHRQLSSVLADNYSGRKIFQRGYAPPPRRGPTIRCFHFAGLRGRLLTGLRTANGPRFELPAGTVVRRLGPLGIWVIPAA